MNTILVTGGSRGLGLKITEDLLSQGNHIFTVSRRVSDRLNSLKLKYPGRLEPLEFDLSQTDSIREDLFMKHIGSDRPIDGLVNNAAVSYENLVTDFDQESVRNMFQVGVFSAMELSKLVLRNMILHRRAGSIVHISSITAHRGYKGLSMYAASKGALEAFSRNLAREWGSRGIRSNCVVPGFLETEMTSELSPEIKQKIFARNSLKKATSLPSVASTVSFLLSERSNSITGQNFIVDAGSL